VIISLLVVIFVFNAKAANNRFSRKRKIPAPQIEIVQNPENTQDGIVIIEGLGFIKNYPSAHKVFLKKVDVDMGSEASKKQKGKRKNKLKNIYKVDVLKVEEDSLTIRIPQEIPYGDYELYIKLKTKFFKSKLNKSPNGILIRPPAPSKPSLSHQVIDSLDELETINLAQFFEEHPLKIKLPDQMQIGKNSLQTFYIEDGFESLLSEASGFYFLPQEMMQSELEIESESPLIASAIAHAPVEESIDVSPITNVEIRELSKHFYLTTPRFPRYLEHVITLIPVFIERIHVKKEEFAILTNRSSNDFSLQGCNLSDSIKERHHLEDNEVLAAKSSLQVNANLGLNDTTPDSLSLLCPNQNGTVGETEDTENLKLIDKFSYSKVDEDGFGVRG